jgi:serine/threonine protein kinase
MLLGGWQGVHPAGLDSVHTPELRQFIELCIDHDAGKRPEARQLLKHPFFDSIRPCGKPGSELNKTPSQNPLSSFSATVSTSVPLPLNTTSNLSSPAASDAHVALDIMSPRPPHRAPAAEAGPHAESGDDGCAESSASGETVLHEDVDEDEEEEDEDESCHEPREFSVKGKRDPDDRNKLTFQLRFNEPEGALPRAVLWGATGVAPRFSSRM